MTDANLILGRLIPDFFPKIFGKSEKEALDIEASKKAFEDVVELVNQRVSTSSEGKKLSLDEVAYGYVRAFCDRCACLDSILFLLVCLENRTLI